MTVDTVVMQNAKSDDSSAYHDDFLCPASPTQVRRTANDCGRLRTIAKDCGHKRNDLASPPGPLDPDFKTGTLLLRIREKRKKTECEYHTYLLGHSPSL